MTDLMAAALERVSRLPLDEQDALAALLLAAYEPDDLPALDAGTRAAIRDGLAQAERGEFASEHEIEALWGQRHS